MRHPREHMVVGLDMFHFYWVRRGTAPVPMNALLPSLSRRRGLVARAHLCRPDVVPLKAIRERHVVVAGPSELPASGARARRARRQRVRLNARSITLRSLLRARRVRVYSRAWFLFCSFHEQFTRL